MNADPYRGLWGGKACRDSPVQTERQCTCAADGEHCEAGLRYAEQLEEVLQHTCSRKRVAAFFAESIQVWTERQFFCQNICCEENVRHTTSQYDKEKEGGCHVSYPDLCFLHHFFCLVVIFFISWFLCSANSPLKTKLTAPQSAVILWSFVSAIGTWQENSKSSWLTALAAKISSSVFLELSFAEL